MIDRSENESDEQYVTGISDGDCKRQHVPVTRMSDWECKLHTEKIKKNKKEYERICKETPQSILCRYLRDENKKLKDEFYKAGCINYEFRSEEGVHNK